MEEKSLGDTQGGAQALLDTRADKVAELEAVTPGDTLGDACALVDTLADTVQEMKEYLVVGKRVGTQALMDEMADTLAEVEAVTPGDTLGDRYALNDLLGDSWRHTGQCAGSGQQAG